MQPCELAVLQSQKSIFRRFSVETATLQGELGVLLLKWLYVLVLLITCVHAICIL